MMLKSKAEKMIRPTNYNKSRENLEAFSDAQDEDDFFDENGFFAVDVIKNARSQGMSEYQAALKRRESGKTESTGRSTAIKSYRSGHVADSGK